MDDEYEVTALPPGTQLHEFVLGEVLGRGGAGIVYRAEHAILRESYAIKEFLPESLAFRDHDGMVRARADQGRLFARVRQKFLQEGQTLVRLARPQSHPNLVQITDAFRHNQTVYLCMRYEQCQTLQDVLDANPPPDETGLRTWLMPLLDGLAHAHAHQIWHRDIKPSNILIRDDGSPVLIDFGAARQEQPQRQVSIIAQYTPGFAAPEQLFGGKQGPWTDIYAMAATVYYALTGSPPLVPLKPDWFHDYLGDYSQALLRAVDIGLHSDSSQRPQSVAQWIKLFDATDDTASTQATALTWSLDLSAETTPVETAPSRTGALAAEPEATVVTHLNEPPPDAVPQPEAPVPSVADAAAVSDEHSTVPPRRSLRIWILGLLGLAGLGGGAGVAYWSGVLDQWVRPSPPPLVEPALVEPVEHATGSDTQSHQTAPDQAPTPVPARGSPECPWSEPVLCELTAVLDQLKPQPQQTADRPRLTFNRAGARYIDGDYLVLNIDNDTAAAGYLRLDFIDGAGDVVHLFPNRAQPSDFIVSGAHQRIGARNAAECDVMPDACFLIAPPHGTNLAVLIWSEEPLLDGPRLPQVESARAYFGEMALNLSDLTRRGGRYAIAYRTVITQGEPGDALSHRRPVSDAPGG